MNGLIYIGFWLEGGKKGKKTSYTDRAQVGNPLPLKGAIPETNEIVTHICSCHNFFPLSSVQILLIPACCLLCVL